MGRRCFPNFACPTSRAYRLSDVSLPKAIPLHAKISRWHRDPAPPMKTLANASADRRAVDRSGSPALIRPRPGHLRARPLMFAPKVPA
jgi:hypothetical protein